MRRLGELCWLARWLLLPEKYANRMLFRAVRRTP